jgi:hypothetical protein
MNGIKKGFKSKKPSLPVDSERVFNKAYGGFAYIKVSMQDDKKTTGTRRGTWVPKHYSIWESINGPIPDNNVILFADQDRNNFNINNLLLVSMREFSYMTRYNFLTTDSELTRTNLVITKHYLATLDAINRLTGDKARHYMNKYRRSIRCST